MFVNVNNWQSLLFSFGQNQWGFCFTESPAFCQAEFHLRLKLSSHHADITLSFFQHSFQT